MTEQDRRFNTYIYNPNAKHPIYADRQRVPALNPLVSFHTKAISCHKPGEFLIRAWTDGWHGSANKLVGWVMHYTGRFDLADLEWYGFTYFGVAPYMVRDRKGVKSTGMTIQHAVERDYDTYFEYGPAKVLEIPERGYSQ